MNIEDKVSVIIPSFERFEYLKNAIESVENQSYQNFEIIVINDGSKDERYYKNTFNDKVKFLHLETNQSSINSFGPGKVRNFGIEIATGKYIAFLDDDDIWLEHKLSIQLEQMNYYKTNFSCSEAFYGNGAFDKNTKYQKYNKEVFFKTIKQKYKNSGYFKNNDSFPRFWSYNFLKIHNCIITSSVVVEKKLLNHLNGFRGLPYSADYDCWLGLLQHTDCLYIDEPLTYYDGSHGYGQNYFK